MKMKKKSVFAIGIVMIFACVICLLLGEDEQDLQSRNVEMLALPPEQIPNDYQSSVESKEPLTVIRPKASGVGNDTIVYILHKKECYGTGFLKCTYFVDVHSVDEPDNCTWK